MVFKAYDWKGGIIGKLDDGRTVALGRQALKVGAKEVSNAAWRYPQARLDRIKAQLDTIDANAGTASGADRQTAIAQRDAALETAGTTLLRVRFHYCSASRDADKTPELAKIEYQPKRDYGTVQEAKKAGAGGAAAPDGGAANPSAGTGATP